MPRLTKNMMKELLEKTGLEMEKYRSKDVRLLGLPSINYDVLKELRWWTNGAEAWLSDKIIDAYLELICARSRSRDDLPKVHAMNTHFLTALSRDGEYNHDNVHDWTKNTDIFAFDLILVPVHRSDHWSMSIIDMRMENKKIRYYDSMNASGDEVLIDLLNYLKDEHRVKKGSELDNDWEKQNVSGLTIPQQDNGHDCGVFACMYAEFITRSCNEILDRSSFSQNDIPYFRKKMAYELCVKQQLLAYKETKKAQVE